MQALNTVTDKVNKKGQKNKRNQALRIPSGHRPSSTATPVGRVQPMGTCGAHLGCGSHFCFVKLQRRIFMAHPLPACPLVDDAMAQPCVHNVNVGCTPGLGLAVGLSEAANRTPC